MGRRRARQDFLEEDSGGEGDEAEVLRKRPADNTERMIQDILKEDVARKKAKGGAPDGPEKSRVEKTAKGKTLAEIEEEEGGPVKESLVRTRGVCSGCSIWWGNDILRSPGTCTLCHNPLSCACAYYCTTGGHGSGQACTGA